VQAGPNRRTAARASAELLRLASASDGRTRADAGEVLTDIADAHARTLGGAAAHYAAGKLYLQDGEVELAEQHLALALVDEATPEVRESARSSLAELRYAVGTEAFGAGDFEKAAAWLGRLLPDVRLVREADAEGVPMPESDTRVEQKRRRAALCLAEAQERLGRWTDAAATFEKLLATGYMAEDYGMFKLVRCYVRSGDFPRADKAYERLADQHPQSPYVAQAATTLSQASD